jgi:hypothetical protein
MISRLLFFALLALFHQGLNSFLLADDNLEPSPKHEEGVVVCVHPEDEALGHTVKLVPECRPVIGHGGVLNQEKTAIEICAGCHKVHQALATQCKPTTARCRKKRPTADY